MSPRNKLLLMLVTLALLACQSLSGASFTPTPAANVPDLPESKNLVFVDDFSDTETGWVVENGANYSAGYQGEEYRILITAEDTIFPSGIMLNEDTSDVSVQVDAWQTTASEEAFYGIICRFHDPNNFYMLRITNSGYFGVAKYVNDQFSYLGDENWVEDTRNIIHRGSQKNHLRAYCIGDEIVLYVNDVELAAFRDASLTGGAVGVVAGTLKGNNSLEAFFDDFFVTTP